MKLNATTITIIVVVLAALGYWFFFSGGASQAPLTSSEATQESGAQTRFQALISEMQSVSFKTSIFSDPNFQALIDLSTPIKPEASGRPDPFAPLGSVASTGQ